MLEMSKVLKNIKYKYHDDNLDQIAENILKTIENGDAILLKASNSINLKCKFKSLFILPNNLSTISFNCNWPDYA